MFTALIRKTRQVADDPVLRRWLMAVALGREKRPPSFTAGLPPYLAKGHLPLDVTGAPERTEDFPMLTPAPQTAPVMLPLPGVAVTLEPGSEADLFTREYDDTETLLAVHRFSWLPLMSDNAPTGMVDILWRDWVERYGAPDDGWAWHPYTAAERAINLIDFCTRHGVPGDRDETLALLAVHAREIAARLEYYGDHHTSNHLSNNGRGIYLIGLALGIETAINVGSRILLAEAGRVFSPSGILREGSSHYHLLLTRNYASAWLAARRYKRPEAATLEDITRRALGILPRLVLPGGMPLVGDISPDCPPGFLSCLLPGHTLDQGWAALLNTSDRNALETLKSESRPVSPDRLEADGWINFTHSPWAALLHAPKSGWCVMPGHAHQDMGSLEIHYRDTPLFIDPGRGAYDESGEADAFVRAASHNTIEIDGCEPYPPNRPYYSDSFRKRIAGGAQHTRSRDGVTITHSGYARLVTIGEVSRSAIFEEAGFTITDRIEGTGQHRIARRLHTPLAAHQDGNDVILEGNGLKFRVSAAGPMTIRSGKRWIAYGISEPCNILEISDDIALPTRLKIAVKLDAP